MKKKELIIRDISINNVVLKGKEFEVLDCEYEFQHGSARANIHMYNLPSNSVSIYFYADDLGDYVLTHDSFSESLFSFKNFVIEKGFSRFDLNLSHGLAGISSYDIDLEV